MVSAHLKTERTYTENEFLSQEREADERHEYIEGVIYAMAGESPTHGIITVNLVRIVSADLLGTPCSTFTKDMKVRSGPLPRSRLSAKGLFSYPDLLVVCGEMRFLDERQDVLLNPTVIIEVLSDATEKFDRNQKFIRYQQYLPSLVDYVLVSQDEPLIELFHRESSNSWRYTFTNKMSGRIHIPSINCDLRMSDVYDRVGFPKPETRRRRPKRTPAKKGRTGSGATGKRQPA
jgi:Uma2 family endonuclease